MIDYKFNVDWSEAFDQEQTIRHQANKQATTGINFNKKRAGLLLLRIREAIINIDIELIPLLPMMLYTNDKKSYAKVFLKKGGLTSHVIKYCDRVDLDKESISGSFSPAMFKPFDTTKKVALKEELYKSGWIPYSYNMKKVNILPFQVTKKLRKANNIKKAVNDCLSLSDTVDREDLIDMLKKHVKVYFDDVCIQHRQKRLKLYRLSNHAETLDIVHALLINKAWYTSPKIDVDNDRWEDTSVENKIKSGLMRDRLKYQHRNGLVAGLISKVRPDGRIEAQADTNGTNTSRMKHKIVCNIPSTRTLLGKECRSLFMSDFNSEAPARVYKYKKDKDCFKHYVKKGFDTKVGWDGSALELRCLTHWLLLIAKASGDKDVIASAELYRKTLLSGDIHSHNQELAGLPTRNSAKTFIYAFLYGSGAENLGAQLGRDKKFGEDSIKSFMDATPSIAVLIDWVKDFGECGYVPSIDGRKTHLTRDESGRFTTYKALNSLLQSTGAIIMKRASMIVDEEVKKQGLGVKKINDIHDEVQYTVDYRDVESFVTVCKDAMITAGEHYNLLVPFACDVSVGSTWAHTH